MGFIMLISIQLFLCVCIVTAVEECPAGFEKIKGIDHRCFYYYVDSTGNILSYAASFSDAQEIYKGKNATVCEPKTFEEGDAIYKFVEEKRNWANTNVWINYHDMQDQRALLGGGNDSVLLTLSYMGSLSTFEPMPIEWWNESYNKGGKRRKYYDGTPFNCAEWFGDGVADMACWSNQLSVLCEIDASQNS